MATGKGEALTVTASPSPLPGLSRFRVIRHAPMETMTHRTTAPMPWSYETVITAPAIFREALERIAP